MAIQHYRPLAIRANVDHSVSDDANHLPRLYGLCMFVDERDDCLLTFNYRCRKTFSFHLLILFLIRGGVSR